MHVQSTWLPLARQDDEVCVVQTYSIGLEDVFLSASHRSLVVDSHHEPVRQSFHARLDSRESASRLQHVRERWNSRPQTLSD
jgi:hypothetical protein